MRKGEFFSPYNPEEELVVGIQKNGGWVNSHSHLDRAFTLTPDNYHLANRSLQEKWDLVDTLKRDSTVGDIYARMAHATEYMLEQGVQAIGTFIDVDGVVKDKNIQAAEKVRDEYPEMRFVFMNQALKGILDREHQQWFLEGAAFVDVIGGLPGKDRGREQEHIDLLLGTAKNLGKRVHVHVDQFNDPSETETELLAERTIAHNMEGKVTAIHGISIAAHPENYRRSLYRKMKEADLSVIACPSAWIDSRRNETLAPTHNAVTPVEEMIEEGIVVSLGTDNIRDIYKPFSSGNMATELKFLLESLHFYDQEKLIEIASINGLKTLGVGSLSSLEV